MTFRCTPRTLAMAALLCASGCFTPEEPMQGGSSSEGSGSEASSSTTSDLGSTSSDAADESSTSEASPDDSSTTGGAAVCGNGVVEGDEACDDAINDGGYGGCAPDCSALAARCGDGIVDPRESCDDGNRDGTDGCLADCSTPTDCMDVRSGVEGAASGIYRVDSDGPGGYGPYDVYCDMDRAGGGWTLVVVSAEDGHHTWTWTNRALLTTDTFLIGNIAVLDEDYKSAALHLIDFTDLLFVHEPSGLWASYDDVGDATTDVGTFMAALPTPQCEVGSGFAMTDGDLTSIGTSLCSTDLYFHAGDHDGPTHGQLVCEAFDGVDTSATFGPSWSAAGNNGCPFDDPDASSLGPTVFANYGSSDPLVFENLEADGRGFAYGMGVTAANDRLEMYVR